MVFAIGLLLIARNHARANRITNAENVPQEHGQVAYFVCKSEWYLLQARGNNFIVRSWKANTRNEQPQFVLSNGDIWCRNYQNNHDYILIPFASKTLKVPGSHPGSWPIPVNFGFKVIVGGLNFRYLFHEKNGRWSRTGLVEAPRSRYFDYFSLSNVSAGGRLVCGMASKIFNEEDTIHFPYVQDSHTGQLFITSACARYLTDLSLHQNFNTSLAYPEGDNLMFFSQDGSYLYVLPSPDGGNLEPKPTIYRLDESSKSLTSKKFDPILFAGQKNSGRMSRLPARLFQPNQIWYDNNGLGLLAVLARRILIVREGDNHQLVAYEITGRYTEVMDSANSISVIYNSKLRLMILYYRKDRTHEVLYIYSIRNGETILASQMVLTLAKNPGDARFIGVPTDDSYFLK